jgi:hypothetical protein
LLQKIYEHSRDHASGTSTEPCHPGRVCRARCYAERWMTAIEAEAIGGAYLTAITW